MRATEHLQIAFYKGMAEHPDLHRRWINLMHRVGSRWGVAHTLALASTSRIDLLLRLLEREQLEQIQSQAVSDADGMSGDILVAMAETWVLRCYEVIRASAQQSRARGETNLKLNALKHRFGLVRMAIAKAEIQAVRSGSPEIILDVVGGERDPRPYANDGSYIVPRGMCGATGAVVWWPVDVKRMETVEICRRDLSDEFLSLLD
ncbi:hypothetical protein ACWGPT_06950 [Pseudorhizobium sp. NPDC055634]